MGVSIDDQVIGGAQHTHLDGAGEISGSVGMHAQTGGPVQDAEELLAGERPLGLGDLEGQLPARIERRCFIHRLLLRGYSC